MREFPFPLPPLPEQRRIVARIDQLMALCGALEARLSAQASTQSALLGSLMDAVTPARSAPTPRPRPARPAASAPAPANAAQPSPVQSNSARGRGRPRKDGGIPTASSLEDAIRQLDARVLERAQGSRQVGLFEDEG